jgi:hypothetical protein
MTDHQHPLFPAELAVKLGINLTDPEPDATPYFHLAYFATLDPSHPTRNSDDEAP